MAPSPTPHVRSLTAWYRRQRRDLPWRRRGDPYAIWISEIMLQQTQVATVIPYFERFLAAFPTVKALAQAEESSVLALWSGLGYYSRARNLWRGARYLMEQHGGAFPKTRDEILKVPGVGPYTAGAILSIAFGLHEPLVDGNVARVFSRFYGWSQPQEDADSQKFYWAQARDWVEAAEHPGDLNQALMEWGATLCTKHSPTCGACPVAPHCVALREGTAATLPVRRPKREKVTQHWVSLLLEHRGAFYVRPNPPGWWEGLWDFPRRQLPKPSSPAALRALEKEWGSRPQPLAPQTHTVTHHRLTVTPIRLPLLRRRRPEAGGQWVDRATLDTLPISSLARKILRAYDLGAGGDD